MLGILWSPGKYPKIVESWRGLMWPIPLLKRFYLRASQSPLQKIPFETSVRDNDVTPRLPTFIVPVGDLRLHVV